MNTEIITTVSDIISIIEEVSEARVIEEADTFRHKFSPDIIVELFRFAKIHQYEDRDTFKESWADWVADSEEMILQETDRLRNNNYNGDILVKMFKSTKYYFCHKSMATKLPATRKTYDGSDRELLDSMDTYILTVAYKLPPKLGFIQFCEMYDKNVGDAKVKKMFKNRHFRIVREHAK